MTELTSSSTWRNFNIQVNELSFIETHTGNWILVTGNKFAVRRYFVISGTIKAI
jgi:hypothetical protein